MKNRFPSFLLAAISAGLFCQGPLKAQNSWTYSYSGNIISWTAPQAGNYTITATGAQGGQAILAAAPGGAGAVVSGTFELPVGIKLTILVGGMGFGGSDFTLIGGGGGGGTYVVDSSNNSPLVVAGGGGGSFWNNTWGTFSGGNASLTTAGGNATYGGSGGINGSGGTIGVNSPTSGGGGGGGFDTNGGTHYSGSIMQAQGGFSFNTGGWGGAAIQNVGAGGFGGGGGGGGSTGTSGGGGGGGGGGYSGGGGGGVGNIGPPVGTQGGGGGSYISLNATNTSMSLGQIIYDPTNPGLVNNGLVQISLYGSDVTWTGAAGNGNWTDSANWTLPFVAGTVVYFAGSNQTDVDTVTDQTVGGIVFDAGADPFTISNNIITLTGNVINQSSANQTIYSGITLATNANLFLAALASGPMPHRSP